MTGKKIEIECFLKIFAKHETLKILSFQTFKMNSFMKKNFLASRKK